MKRGFTSLLLVSFILGLFVFEVGCKKDETAPVTGVDPNAPTYPVTATILNPQGQPQGGATLTMLNVPSTDPKYVGISDSTGKATIQAPAGPQVLVAKMGSAFLTQFAVNVLASQTGTVVTTPVRLTQNTNVKVLVVQASAEVLEDVLHTIGFATFDSTDIYTLRDSANVDSTGVLNLLKKYTLVFSNCDGGSEGGSTYAALSRVYGRYINAGGKMYGGHYNYYHLQRVWPPFYTQFNYGGNTSTDSLSIVDATLAGYVGYNLAKWVSIDSRNLSGYEKFNDLPTGAKTYGVIKGVSPAVSVIVENYKGTGKYLWTDYHNQDIKNDPKLVKIVQYFLLNM